MRKLLTSLLMIVGFSAPCLGGVTQNVTVVNEAGLSYSTTPVVNLNNFAGPNGSANKLAAQVTWASATFTNGTFTDGTQSTGNITVVSTAPLAAAKANDTITVPALSAILGQAATVQITIASNTALSGACLNFNTIYAWSFCNGSQWTSVGTASGTASALATALNGVNGVLASWPGGSSAVVYATAAVNGVAGNSYTVTSSTQAALSVSSTSFLNGKDRALHDGTLFINGQSFRNGVGWDTTSNTSTGTAISITALLNNFGVIVATTDGSSSVVYATATTAGTAGNSFTRSLTTGSGQAGLNFGSANFTGGQDNASVTINGKTLTYGTDWTYGASTTTTTTAKSLAAAINTSFIGVITSTNVAGVVYATSTAVGTATNYAWSSSTQSALSVSGPAMAGGTNAGYSMSTEIITITNHGFTKALPVLYSTGTKAIGGLTNQTTYYVIVVDANNIELATSQANALAGTFINITSSTTQTTADTYTLAPLAFSLGSGSAKWQVSNDGVNWADYSTTAQNVSVSSQTFTASGTTTNVQDYGFIDFNYMRYNITGPSQGGLLLKVYLNSKD